VDPHGDPIPTAELSIDEGQTRSLDKLPPGARGRFVRVSDSDPAKLRYIADQGIALGDRLEVTGHQPFGGPLFVRVGEGEGAFDRAFGGELAHSMRIAVEQPDELSGAAEQAAEAGRWAEGEAGGDTRA
jgi:DtxR family Mn-dependent transcriptional regulator